MLRKDDGALRILTWIMLLFGAIFLVSILMTNADFNQRCGRLDAGSDERGACETERKRTVGLVVGTTVVVEGILFRLLRYRFTT